MKKKFLVLIFLCCIICAGYAESAGFCTGVKFFDVGFTSTMDNVESFMEGISFSEKVKEKHVLEYKDVKSDGKKFNKIRYEFYNDYSTDNTSKLSTVHIFVDENWTVNQVEKELDKFEYVSRQESYFTENGIIKKWKVKGCVVFSFCANSIEKMNVPRGYSPFL